MTAEERMRERAAQICAKNRRHIELSPGAGVERQSYGWAVCDDIESDIRALPLEGERGEPAEDQRKQTSDAKTTD